MVILDYQMGNVSSVRNALSFLGYSAAISSEPKDMAKADVLFLPGVGAFGDGMQALQHKGLIEPLKNHIAQGRPLIGICLGMQLLLDKSYEMGEHAGLGVVKGEVRRFPFDKGEHKIPHMGWNHIHAVRQDPVFAGIPQDAYGYFVHSYYVEPADESVVLARTEYGFPFCSMLRQGSVYGLQFHPEKSQRYGLQMLKNIILASN